MAETFHIITYGCQMNTYDSQLIKKILCEAGYKEVDLFDADIIIINGCCVREHAEQRALGRLGVLQGLRRKKPRIIGVVGCLAQNKKKIKGADFVVGTTNYTKLPKVIKTAIDRSLTYKIKDSLCAVDMKNEVYDEILPEPHNNISSFVPVMRGCNNFCTYCIVPYVRGPARFRDYRNIIKEINYLYEKGVKEVILLGQSINEYEFNGVDFAELLSLIDKETDMPWVKFLTSHPKAMNDRIIEVIRESKKLCEFLHMPVQAGSNKILKLMNRKYTKEEYLAWVEKFRKYMPEIVITTDVMVGFPCETEEDFKETLELVKEVKFDYAFMFRYSKRPGTVASKFENQVDEETKLRRLNELIQIQNEITRMKNAQLVGKTLTILCDGKSKDKKMLRGKTRGDRIIVFRGKVKPGEFTKVKIKEIKGWTPVGEEISYA